VMSLKRKRSFWVGYFRWGLTTRSCHGAFNFFGEIKAVEGLRGGVVPMGINSATPPKQTPKSYADIARKLGIPKTPLSGGASVTP